MITSISKSTILGTLAKKIINITTLNPAKNRIEFLMKSNSVGLGYKTDLKIYPLKEVYPTLITLANTFP